MILRTPQKQKRRIELVPENEIPVSDRQLVPYVEQSDDMICTYHCRQMVKSEFLAALNTTEKQVHEYKSRLEALENELFKSEQERQKSQDHFHYVEQELQASKGREHALQEQLLKEIADHQERYHTQLKKCSELEVQLKKEVQIRRSVELSAEAAKEKASAVEKELLLVSESYEREKKRLHLSFLHLQDESKLSLSRANAELERMRTRADCFEKEAELLRKSLGDLKEQMNKETELHEARQLKSSQMNKELLMEQLLEEKGRREKAETEINRLQEIEAHAQKFESELISWKSLLNQIPDVSCYDDIPKKYAQLQKETIECMLKVDVADARLKELQATLEAVNLSKEHAEKECKLEQKRADCLALEVKRLEFMLGHGDYSTSNTKVLRMVNSLGIDNEAKRTIEVLRADLQKTKAKLQAIEDLCGQSDFGNAINVGIPEKLSQLKEQIAILEKREERYKAVFAEKISVFRRACCSLFGYKIVMDDQQRPNGIPVTRFILQSIYAQNDEEKLEFEYESGNATILDNDYTSQMEIHHQVDIFVRKMNSIPAFTANLTVESFNKRTLS